MNNTPTSVVCLGDDESLPLHGMPAGPVLPDTRVCVLLGQTASGKPVYIATSSMELLDCLREAIDAAGTMLVPARPVHPSPPEALAGREVTP